MDLIVVELGWREVEKVRQRMRVNDIVFASRSELGRKLLGQVLWVFRRV